MAIANEVRRRLLRGIGANLYGQVIVSFIQLAGVPILLHAWGTRTYGEWLILSAIPSYLSMTDLGFAVAASNDMTGQVALGNKQGALAVFQSLFGLIAVMNLAVLAVGGFLIWILPLDMWFKIAHLSALQFNLTLFFLCSAVLLKMFDGVNHSGFRSNGDYALHTGVYYTIAMIQQLAVWGMALTGYGPCGAAAAFLAVVALAVPLTGVLLIVRHSWLRFGFAESSFAELRRLFAPAFGNLAIPLSQALNIQGMILVIAGTLGPIAVVTFSTLRTLTRITIQLVATISGAAEPEFAMIGGSKDFAKGAALYLRAMRASVWLALAAALGLAATGSWILRFWTHGRVTMNRDLFFWLLATVLSQTLWHGALAMLKGWNRHLSAAMVQAVTSAAALALAWLFLKMTGNLTFAGISLFISDVAFVFFTVSTVRKVFGISPIATALGALDPRPLQLLVSRLWSQRGQG